MADISSFPAAAGELPLRVLTFNLWGIFNSKMREARMRHFASKIDHYDILLLQEQFSVEDFETIFRHASPAVQQSYDFCRFRSSFYGSGCAVISRYPIKHVFFHTFPLQGTPEMVLHGDFFANKGAAMVRIMVPVPAPDGGAGTVQEVTLYTTHLVAVYQKVSQLSSWRRERYLPFRISQALSFANFIMSTSRPADRIIVGGDFNCAQRSLEVQMLLILLRRHGYDLRSALPPPRALLDAATTTQEQESAQQLFTYSYHNAFNAMKTSYFKLLRLEADIPAQIDHIFFSSRVFTLREFAQCPDVAAGYPRTLPDGANGLVVFTNNEVYVPPQPTWYGAVWHSILTGGRRRPGNGGKVAQHDDAAARAEHLYPLSDHYGVAALLGMQVEVAGSPTSLAGPGSEMRGAAVSALTPDEARVVQTVVDYLEDYVCTLRSQIKTTRYLAATSIVLVATHIWVLHRLSAMEEARTAAMIEQLYDIAAANTRPPTQVGPQSDRLEAVVRGVGVARDWVVGQTRHAVGVISTAAGRAPPPPAQDRHEAVAVQAEQRTTAPVVAAVDDAATAPAVEEDVAAAPRPNFRAVAEALAVRPLWASALASSAVNVTAAIVGTASLAIGMFQRAGNANILEEQVNQLKKL
ncbi:inositol phosphosphingolipid phospholipase C-Like [Novymonas esmeraldas]|uniref:Inositol phosphosphingolipid phospholipase C-Like n=1 Tax=Novymonas esmeraldas TaxID=1808958 RepID=A0AAW0FBH5_9TRYP